MRLKELYKKKIIPEVMKRFKLDNPFEVPRIEKIVINMGVSTGKIDVKVFDEAMEELSLITGQRPSIRRAKKSISNFKIRKGIPVGCKVTLHGRRMYEFLDRFINVGLPRIRDFKGVSLKGFDRQANYTLGLSDESIFPEVNLDKITKTKGLSISIVTSSSDVERCRCLLELFGIPFIRS